MKAKKPSPQKLVKKGSTSIVHLSPTARLALVECLRAGELHKTNGYWVGNSSGKPIAGTIVANLRRDGLFAVTKSEKNGCARLTHRGASLAQQFADEVIE
jgi:hypothetical protein